MSVPNPNPGGLGPLGTSDSGRADRIARSERGYLRRELAALRASVPASITDIMAEDLPPAVTYLIGQHTARIASNGTKAKDRAR